MPHPEPHRTPSPYTLSPGGSFATVSVTVNCVNDAPVIANLAGDTLGYTQGDSATPIDQGGDAAAADVDSPDFDTGTLTVSLPGGLVPAEDEIGISNQGTGVNQIGVTGTDVTFNPGSGAVIIGSFSGGGAGGGNLVVTFNASAGDAAVSALLHNITYLNSNTTNPTPANRTVRFVLSDGDGGISLGSDATIAIALNTPPELTAGGANSTFTEDGVPIVLDGALTVTDANDTNLESATVRITAGFQTGQDVLGFVDTPAITGTFDPLTGILTLTGSATLADYQTALRSVTYQNTSQNPNTAARSVAFVANDGSANSNTITTTVTVLSVNDAPSFTASNPPTILEDAGAQTVLSWATFNPGPPDESGQSVVGYTVSNISNGALFSVAPVVAANGTLTYTAAANVNGVSTFDVVVQDDGGIANGGVDTSAPQSFTITVDAVNNAPSFTKGTDQSVNEDAGPQTVNPWATAIDDGDPGVTQALTFNVTGNTNPGLFSAGPSVSPTGVLTYTPAAHASGTANLALTLSDDGGTANGGIDTSAPQSFTVTVNPINDTPAFSPGPNQSVDEDSGAQSVISWATAIDDGDPESTQTLTFNITGNTNPSLFSTGPAVSPSGDLTYEPAANASGIATITLTLSDNGGLANGGADTSAPQIFTITVNDINDPPAFVAGPNQTVNEDAGAQTVSPWATAIDDGDPGATQTLTFNITCNTNPSLFSAGPSVSPTGVLTYTPAANASGTASITLSLSDDGGTANGGDDTSDAQSFTIAVNALNDAPSFIAGPNQSVNEDASAQSVSPWATAIDDGDPESTQALTFNITGNTNPGLFSAPPAISPTGTLIYTPALNAFGSATITLTLSDNGGTADGGVDTSAPQSFTITINAVNDAPSFTAGPNESVFEDAGPQTVSPWATALSPGPANESGQTVSFNITSNTNPSLFSAGPTVSPAGVLTFTPAPNANGGASIMLVIQDSGGTANSGVDTSGPQGFSITVTAVNDPPQVTPPAAYAAHAHIAINIPDGATDLFDGSTISDVDGPGATPFFITAAGPFASANGGSVTIAGNGSFSYNPPVAFTGANDTFLYQICDNGVPGSACTNATATVAVSGPRVWFVNNSLGPGDGRLSSPFNTLGAADTAANTSGDRIFVFTGAGSYVGGFGLLTNQRLIGEGVVDTNFDIALGITPPATSVARPAINGTRPTINGTITLATGSTARGFNVSHTTVTGVSASGASGLAVNQVSVTTTTGTAVNLLNSGGTISFTSVSANGAANGIVLNTTTGSFTVTGTGAAGTGGTIQSTTGDGVSLNGASSVSLSFMNINNNLGNGIRGNNVTGFTLASSTVDNNDFNNNGAAADEAGSHFTNLLGTASITGTTVSNHPEDNARILNSSGTLSQLTITGSTFRDTDTASPGNNGLLIQGDGSASITGDINSSSFLRNRANGVQVINNGSGTVDVEVGTTAACTFQNNNVGANIAHNGAGSLAFDVFNSSFSAPTLAGAASPINLNKATAGTGTMSGTVSGNTITNANSASGPGIRVNGNGVGGTLTTLIQSNNISQVANRGIEVIARDGNNTLNATVTNNIVQLTDPLSDNGIWVESGTVAADTTTICAAISGNDSDTVAGPNGIRMQNIRAGTTFRVPSYGGPATDPDGEHDLMNAHIAGLNPATPSIRARHLIGNSGFIPGGAACPTP